jgi:hypothetical protein
MMMTLVALKRECRAIGANSPRDRWASQPRAIPRKKSGIGCGQKV